MRSERCCYLLLGLLAGLSAKAETKHFDDFNTLCEAARLAEGGDVLILKEGTYSINRAVTFREGEGGNQGLPVIIQSETVGGATLQGDSTAFAFKPGASHVVVSGFKFQLSDETAVKIEGSNHIRVTRCDFELRENDSLDWLVITGSNSHHNRVDHCRFANKIEAGNFISVNGDASGQQSQYDRIDHNRFLNTAPRIKNEKEAIRIGWSGISLSNGFTIVENNYFEKCDGDPEILSIKSCKNIVRYNKIVDSVGVLSLRHGNGTDVYSNILLGKGRQGCGGIRVCGDDHRIYNNYLANLTGSGFSAALAITNGDADGAQPGRDLSKHYRSRRIQIINNSFIDNLHSIEIGYAHSRKKAWGKEPQDIFFANNLVTGKTFDLVNVHTIATDCNWKNNLFWPKKTARIGLSNEELVDNFVGEPRLRTVDNLQIPDRTIAATNTGLVFEFVTQDLARTSRPKAPCLGALESHNNAATLAKLRALDSGPEVVE